MKYIILRIIKLLCKIALLKKKLLRFIRFIEKAAGYLQGKGWSTELTEEFSQIVDLIDGKNLNLCIDIGGNKGFYTDIILKNFPNCKIIIFEPSKTNFEILEEKFKSKNITIEKLAISKTAGITTLYSNEDGSGLASLTKRRLDHFGIEFSMTESITSVCFEEYWHNELNKQHIEFCKLDIEGHELEALEGFGEALKNIDFVQFEFGGCNIDTKTSFQDFWYFFQKNEFEIYRISPLGPIRINSYEEQDESFKYSNYVAKRKLL